MLFLKVLTGIALIGLVGCGRGADLRDQFQKSDDRRPFEKRLRFEATAPIIVVGKVLDVNDVCQPRRSSGAGVGIQLVQIKINVEEVITGDAGLSPIEFYFFEFSPEASEVDLGVPRYYPHAGQRCIFFLKPSNNGYRSVGDVTNYNLRVSSGSHDKNFCDGKSPGCCIAQILLEPGKDLNVEWFAGDLFRMNM